MRTDDVNMCAQFHLFSRAWLALTLFFHVWWKSIFMDLNFGLHWHLLVHSASVFLGMLFAWICVFAGLEVRRNLFWTFRPAVASHLHNAIMADEKRDDDIFTASASLVSDVRDTESTSSTVSESLKNICTILGCLSDWLTSPEKGQSESPVSNSKISGGTARGSEIPTGTDATRSGRINLDFARGEPQTDSDNESNFA